MALLIQTCWRQDSFPGTSYPQSFWKSRIRKAIDVYPESHFGREQWQLVLEEFLLAVIDDPKLLLKFDMIGNRLDSLAFAGSVDSPRPYTFDFSISLSSPFHVVNMLGNSTDTEAPRELRARYITRVGAENDWNACVRSSFREPAAFDEPSLGIVGMWRLGAGANPFFSLAVGEIMLRVGQRYLAWDAYERTLQMKEHIWPDPAIQQGFADRVRKRQEWIEAQLPAVDWSQVRERLNQELAHGREYQAAYRAYEAQRIREGISIDDADFYKAFDEQHAPIATEVGEEEKFVVEQRRRSPPVPSMLLFAGIFAMTAAVVCLRSAGHDRSVGVDPTSLTQDRGATTTEPPRTT